MDDTSYYAQYLLMEMVKSEEHHNLDKADIINNYTDVLMTFLPADKVIDLMKGAALILAKEDPEYINWMPPYLEYSEEELEKMGFYLIKEEDAEEVVNEELISHLQGCFKAITLHTIKDVYKFLLESEFPAQDFNIGRKFIYMTQACFDYLKETYDIDNICPRIKIKESKEPARNPSNS